MKYLSLLPALILYSIWTYYAYKDWKANGAEIGPEPTYASLWRVIHTVLFVLAALILPLTLL